MSFPLYLTFRSFDSSNRVLVCASDDGAHWSGGIDTGARSQNTASQVFFNGKYWAVLVANDSNSVVVGSSDDAQHWSGFIKVPEATAYAPRIAVFKQALWIVFVSNDTNSVALVISSRDGVHWSRNTSVGYTTKFSATLTVFNGQLWAALTLGDAQQRILVCYSDDGTNWSSIVTGLVGQGAPAFAAFNNQLCLVFLARDSNELMASCSPDGRQWPPAAPIGHASKGAPVMAVFNNRLWVAYLANNPTNLILVSSSEDGTHWAANTSVGQTSQMSASLFSRLLYTGTVRPKYQIVTVVYAPPGTYGGRSASQVVYATGSTLGTTISNSSSFKSGVGVSASVGFGGLSVGSEFNYASTDTDSSAVDAKKSQNWDLKVTAPAQDGINHDYDIFYLWLNPLLKVTIDSLNNISWELEVDGPTMILQYVYAGWLKNPASMPPGLKQVLDKAGLTSEDYNQILSTNPFFSGSSKLDPDRFLPTTQSFPYIPPYSPDDTAPSITYSQQNTLTRTATHTTETKYSVGFNVSAGFQGIFSASLKTSTSLEWTNISSSSSSKTSSQSATVTVGGPAYTYTGPTDVLVYWDTVFSSFAFEFADQPASYSGAVTDANENPVKLEPIMLTAGGHQLSTFTDARGGFRFYGAPEGQGEISMRDQKHKVQVGPGQSVSNFKL